MSHNSSNSNELPSWLRGVPLPPRPLDENGSFSEERDSSAAVQSSSIGVQHDAPQPPAAEQTSDWLRDTAAPADDVPSWLSESSAQPAAASDEVPDWLRDLGPDESAPKPGITQRDLNDSEQLFAPAASQEETAVPDWLLDLGGASNEPADEPATPDVPGWMQSDLHGGAVSEHPVSDWGQAAAANDQAAAEDAPDWLSDLGVATPASATSGEQRSDVAEETDIWLTPSDESDDATSAETEVPAWLLAEVDLPASRDVDDAPDDIVQETQPPVMPPVSDVSAAQPDDEGVPGWLNEASLDEVHTIMSAEDDISSDLAPFSFEGPSEPSSSPPADAPAWLQAASEDAETREPSSWLDALTTSQPEAEELHDTPADAPPWLQSTDASPVADVDSFDSFTQSAAAEQDAGPGRLQDAATPDAPELAEPSGDVPAWLQDAGSMPAPDESADATPAWMQDAGTGEATRPAEPGSDVPAWLQDAGSMPAPDDSADATARWLQHAETSDAAEPAEPSSDIPPWLLEAEATRAPEFASPSSDVPGWRQDAETTESPELAESSGDVPPWLQAEQREDAAATDEAAPFADDVPPWLQTEEPAPSQPGEDVPPWLQDESGAALPPSGMPGDANLPAWLQDTPLDSAPPAAPAAPEPAKLAPVSDASLWFDDIGADVTEEPSAAEEPDSEFLGGTELPVWLRPTPVQREQPSEADQRDARALDWLSRLGGVEEEQTVAAPEQTGPRFTPPAAPVRSQEHLNAVALLERLAARPVPEAAALPEAAPKRRWQRAGAERLLYLGLLVILVAALLVPALAASLEVPPVVASAQPLFAQLDTLTENDVVLVGYEWNARRISELRPLERAVMGHILAKKAKLVIVSTDPQGTLVAFDLRQSLADAGYEPKGLDYIWLGYKPGGEVALRSLAQDVPGALRSDFYGDDANISPLARGFRTEKPLTSLESFSTIIVLADEPLDVQGWMEQIHRAVPATPIAFLLPSETAPITQPYMRQPNVFYLAGRSGALAYEELRGTPATDQSVQSQYGQQRLGLLVFAGLLLIAIIIGATTAATRRGKDAA